MPTFEVEATLTQTIDVDFEVYCGTCGTGLCYESSTRRSRNRGYNQVEVNACPNCIEEKDKEIEALKAEIEELNNKLEQ
jgi:hypothetical protein